VGARLAANGAPVTLIGRPRIVDTIRRDGLTVTDLDGFKAHIEPVQLGLGTQVSAELFVKPTVVLLCVKGGGTRAAIQELAAVCPPDTPVISLQNGVENLARIQALAPAMQAVAGMVPFNVVMTQPGVVHRGTTGDLQMGRTAITEQIQATLRAAGLPTVLVEDMRSVQWGKLLINLNNPVNALSNLPLRAQLKQRDYRRVLAALQIEALGVLKAAEIQPAKLTTVSPHTLPHVLRLPDWLFTRVAARMLRMDENARSSMWDDVQQGRTTEVDDLCGAVVRLGAIHQVPTPINAVLCQMMANHRAGQSVSGAELRRATGI
jgi:2-dehydropantoate 2-reductase